MNSNLDVWAIQKYPEELETAINQITKGTSIIYSNLKCEFTLGTEKIESKQLDTLIYNDESDVFIMLMKDGKATKEDAIRLLEEKGLPYGEVTFEEPDIESEYNDEMPELWFAREQYVLEDAIKDSIEKEEYACVYYPNVSGKIDLGYLTKSEEYAKIDGRVIKGVIKFNDKLILIIKQKGNVDENGNDRNLKSRKVRKILSDSGITYEINDSISLKEKGYQYTKRK